MAQERNTERMILEAAEEEFMEKGMAGARTVAIAEKAGVTHAMLHYYFRTKDQLFERIISDKLNEIINSVLSIFADTSLPIGERIEKGMSAHFDFLVKNPYLPRFMVNEIQHLNENLIKPYFPKALNVISSLEKELDGKISPINLILDVVSQNIFPFLVLPGMENSGLLSGDRTALLESIKKENITVIKKRLGL